jgi:hypothetical protein
VCRGRVNDRRGESGLGELALVLLVLLLLVLAAPDEVR